MLSKKYIKSNTFDYIAPMLIIKKLNDNLRICVNYKTLNALIIKNRNALLLIKNILTRLYSVKYFSKFDIIATFNEIRIQQKNKKKTTFLTKYNLFEYVIMLFELCNAFNTF